MCATSWCELCMRSERPRTKLSHKVSFSNLWSYPFVAVSPRCLPLYCLFKQTLWFIRQRTEQASLDCTVLWIYLEPRDLAMSNLAIFSMPVSVWCDRLRQKSWSPSSVSCVAARKIARRSCLGARPRYNLEVDEDVKKPTNQLNKQTNPLEIQHSHKLAVTMVWTEGTVQDRTSCWWQSQSQASRYHGLNWRYSTGQDKLLMTVPVTSWPLPWFELKVQYRPGQAADDSPSHKLAVTMVWTEGTVQTRTSCWWQSQSQAGRYHGLNWRYSTGQDKLLMTVPVTSWPLPWFELKVQYRPGQAADDSPSHKLAVTMVWTEGTVQDRTSCWWQSQSHAGRHHGLNWRYSTDQDKLLMTVPVTCWPLPWFELKVQYRPGQAADDSPSHKLAVTMVWTEGTVQDRTSCWWQSQSQAGRHHGLNWRYSTGQDKLLMTVPVTSWPLPWFELKVQYRIGQAADDSPSHKLTVTMVWTEGTVQTRTSCWWQSQSHAGRYHGLNWRYSTGQDKLLMTVPVTSWPLPWFELKVQYRIGQAADDSPSHKLAVTMVWTEGTVQDRTSCWWQSQSQAGRHHGLNWRYSTGQDKLLMTVPVTSWPLPWFELKVQYRPGQAADDSPSHMLAVTMVWTEGTVQARTSCWWQSQSQAGRHHGLNWRYSTG